MDEHPPKKFSLNPSVAILIVGFAIAGAILYTNEHPAAADAAAVAAAASAPAQVNVPAPKSTDHIIGSPNAPMVLVEYADFECPYCSMVYPTIKSIVQNSNGQIAWVMRNFPLTTIHPEAMPAAIAAECINGLLGNDAYWKYVDAVYTNQSQLSADYSRQLALSFGADPAAYDSCVAQDTYADRIQADEGDAISNGGSGTPYTVVYTAGYQAAIPGALPQDEFEAVIKSVENRQNQG